MPENQSEVRVKGLFIALMCDNAFAESICVEHMEYLN